MLIEIDDAYRHGGQPRDQHEEEEEEELSGAASPSDDEPGNNTAHGMELDAADSSGDEGGDLT